MCRYTSGSEWSSYSSSTGVKVLPPVLLTSSVCVSALTVSRGMGIGSATADSPGSSSLSQMRVVLV